MHLENYFAKRTNWQLAENDISTSLKCLKQKEKVIDLSESNPTRCGFKYDNIISRALSNKKNYLYEPNPKGLHQAREVVARYYREKGIIVSPDDIFLTSSTSEGYSFLFRLLLNPGEGIFLPQPSHPLFQFLCDINDVESKFYQLAYEDNWRIDFNSIENNLSGNTRAIVLVNPNNPTGSFVKESELASLNNVCQKKNMAIICDEVFFDYGFDKNDKKPSLASNRESLTFVLSGISKILALPQMKLSWIVVSGPKELKDEAIKRLEVITDTYLSVNSATQNALAHWFKVKNSIQKQIMQRVLKNYELAKKEMNSEIGDLFNVEGGWYVILKIKKEANEEALCLELLEKEKVFVHPGYFFDFNHGSHLVISLLPEPKDFSLGIQRIAKSLS